MKRKKRMKKRRDILFLCQYFYPENNSSATLPYDTARYFAEQGYRVGVVCGYPKEYFDGSEVPLEEEHEGIHIHRIPYIQSRRTGKAGRLVNYFSFTASVFLQMRLFRGYRCIICYSNPPILPVAAMRAARRYGSRFIFVAYDIYPEVAYASANIREGNLADRSMRRMNQELFRRTSRVIALTEEMRAFILATRPEISSDRISVIYNWAHEENEAPEVRLPELVGTGTDTDKSDPDFCVSYFGNMGICQDVDTILDAAERTAGDDGIRYELIGHGNKKDRVEARIRDRHLRNCGVYPYMTGEALGRKLAGSSCCVVSLTEGLKGMCAPSKYLTYLYAGKPVISIMETDACISREVVSEGIGFAVRNGDSRAFEQAVRWLREHPREAEAMGRKAGELYRRKYCFGIAMSKYKETVDSVLRQS